MTRTLIVGGGGVLGQALGAEFASSGSEVICLRRFADAVGNGCALTLGCDLGDPAQVHRAVSRVAEERGPIDTLIHNAAQFVTAPFLELASGDFEDAWLVGVAGAIAGVKAALPAMLRQGHGTLLFTGATASLRGGARWATLASAKFALRGLAQALAREYHPQGIHVGHVVIDGLLKGSPSIERFGGNEESAIDPAAVARTFRWLAEQPPSAWTHEIDVRPNRERF